MILNLLDVDNDVENELCLLQDWLYRTAGGRR